MRNPFDFKGKVVLVTGVAIRNDASIVLRSVTYCSPRKPVGRANLKSTVPIFLEISPPFHRKLQVRYVRMYAPIPRGKFSNGGENRLSFILGGVHRSRQLSWFFCAHRKYT